MRARIAAVVAVVAVVVAVLVWWWTRGGTARPAGEPAGGRSGIRPGVSGVMDRDRVAGRRYNERGQPLNAEGRPIGPPVGWRPENVQRYAPGELPTSPPILDDPAQREAYRRYWVDEMKRRAAIWAKEHPGEYPDDAEATRLMERLYDASEQWPLDGTAEDTFARGRELDEAMHEFLDAYGEMPKSISTFGEDPQYGAVPPPPFELPGAAPAEPAPMVEPDAPGRIPPGRPK